MISTTQHLEQRKNTLKTEDLVQSRSFIADFVILSKNDNHFVPFKISLAGILSVHTAV